MEPEDKSKVPSVLQIGKGESVIKMELTQMKESQLTELFTRLQGIKKIAKLNIFKKKSDFTEEELIESMIVLIDHMPAIEIFQFMMLNAPQIDVFFCISFNPQNKNKKLTELCHKACIKLITRISEVYIDITHQRRAFAISSPGGKNKIQPQMILSDSAKANFTSIFQKASDFLALIFTPSTKNIVFKMKTDKLKILKNLEARLQENDPKVGTKSTNPLMILKDQVKETMVPKDEARFLSMTQAYFELVGELICRSEQTKTIEIRTETYTFEIKAPIKHKSRIFGLLDHIFEILLAIEVEQYQIGLMSLMEKNIAKYISQILEESTNPKLDLELFLMIFKLINQIFQQRKRLINTSNDEDDDLDCFTSGMSSGDEKIPKNLSTLSKEFQEEITSFRYLQSMTGKLYLQLIDTQVDEIKTTSASNFDIFTFFTKSSDMDSYLEVFEPQYSQKLIKKVITKFQKLAYAALKSQHLMIRMTTLFKFSKCTDRKCGCFIYEMMNIFFKLAMKCPISVTQSIMEQFLELMKICLRHPSLTKRIPECFFLVFSKTFTSLLSQNLETVMKMTIRVMSTDIDSIEQPGQRMYTIEDLRKTSSISPRKINLFFDLIKINDKQVRLTKEMCESILFVIADTPGVSEFLAGQPYRIDLELDDYYLKVTSQDILELIQDRWQVRLLSYRNLLIQISARLLKEIYFTDRCERVFHEYWDFFKEMNLKRGQSLHSFYLAFITNTFSKYFAVTDHKVECFEKYLLVLDIYLKGLGTFDRDSRMPLPIKIQKEFVENMLIFLQPRADISDTKLLMVQCLIAYRVQDMLTRDPPILKSLIPLLFDLSNELLQNFDKIDMRCKNVADAVKIITEDKSVKAEDAVLLIIVKLFTCVLGTTNIYHKFPIILRPEVMVSGNYIQAGGFPYQTFADIENQMKDVCRISTILSLIDHKAVHIQPHRELCKFLNLLSRYYPTSISKIFQAMLAKTLDPVCSDAIFKLRMKLLISLIAIEKNDILDVKMLNETLDQFQLLFQNNLSTLSDIKKQWFFTVLIKWVYLSTASELPIAKIRKIVSYVRESDDEYLVQNSIIVESYLSALRGLYVIGEKSLRYPSIFDEKCILSKNKLEVLMRLIDKFYRRETMEEEARLLQQSFNTNLFEFFSDSKLGYNFHKLIDEVLKEVKPVETEWTYVFDAMNVILYSIAEIDKGEICLIKRHIAGKSCWFLKESMEGLYAEKEKLNVLDPSQCKNIEQVNEKEDNNITRLIDMYRKQPGLFDIKAMKSGDNDILALEVNSQQPTRVNNLDTYPDYLRGYWKEEKPKEREVDQKMRTMGSIDVNFVASEGKDIQDEGSESNLGDSSPQNSFRSSSMDSRPERSKEKLRGSSQSLNPSLDDPKIRFILQFGLYNQMDENKKSLSDYYTFSINTPALKERFKASLSIIDKTKIINTFKVGILLLQKHQDKEEEVLSNPMPQSGLFLKFVNKLGTRHGENIFEKSLGNDVIQYLVGPLITRKDTSSTFEVKRIVGNVPTLIIWSQNPQNINYEHIKSKVNKEIIVIEEMPNGLLKVRTIQRTEEQELEAVYRIDGLMQLDCLMSAIHSYIFSSQMELNPKIFTSLQKEYKTASPFLEARKKKIKELCENYSDNLRKMNLETMLDIMFANKL